jgi:hypothetical protein
MSLVLKRDTRDISFGGLSNPEGMISLANANIHRVMPKMNSDNYHNSVGVIESGGVDLDTSATLAPLISVPQHSRKKKIKKSKLKRKNKRKT